LRLRHRFFLVRRLRTLRDPHMTLTNQETTAILVGLRLLQHTNIPGTSIYNIPATLPGQGVVRVGLLGGSGLVQHALKGEYRILLCCRPFCGARKRLRYGGKELRNWG
jgi:hypothetical protein